MGPTTANVFLNRNGQFSHTYLDSLIRFFLSLNSGLAMTFIK